VQGLAVDLAFLDVLWTCFEKVESFPEMKGELDDEAETINAGIRG
jgi:hypothetical protein